MNNDFDAWNCILECEEPGMTDDNRYISIEELYQSFKKRLSNENKEN